MQAHAPDYPVLIVDGDLELSLKSSEKGLLESEWATNFNPPGTPYGGVTDFDLLDAYPNRILGLVHVTGNLIMTASAGVGGVVICGGAVTCNTDASVIYDPDIYANPPQGYTDYSKDPAMTFVAGTWSRVVD